MLAYAHESGSDRPRGELLVLVLASVASVVIVAAGSSGTPLGWTPVIVAAIGAAAVLLAMLALGARQAGEMLPAAERFADMSGGRGILAAADAIVSTEPQTVLVWERDAPLHIVIHALADVPGVPRDHAELLRFGHWLEPGSTETLRTALERLFREGQPFSLVVKTMPGGHIEADGRAVGGRAIVRLRDMAGYRRELLGILDRHGRLGREIRASRALLDALPVPVWFKDGDGRLTWVNSAYSRAVEAEGEQDAVERQIELLDTRQRQSVARHLARSQSYRKRVQLGVSGERRAHDVIVLPVEDISAAAALDASAVETAKDELDRQMQAFDRTLDRVTTAVAIFNHEQRLTFWNEAYLKLWPLDESWLETRPSDTAVLDRLRELGRLPQVVDFRAWKTQILSCYETGLEPDTRWHLPDGRVLHVIAELRPDGGVTYLYVDETERLALESRFNALFGVQRETLNSLKEGVAVFAPDGRLKLFNSAFAAIWKLSPQALDQNPHIDEIVALSRLLYDEPRVWADVSRTVTSFSDEREFAEGQMLRADATVIEYAAKPLPDGATLLTFSDVTASKRYERALEERTEALVVADKLKSQFIGHVSYELRTPLTNIIGFSELLASPRNGHMSEKQREYLKDIESSSKTLLAIIDDILDLATIDAGTLELELGQVAVRGVIEAAIRGVRDRAARARLTLDIGVSDDAQMFTADEARVRQVLYNLLTDAVSFSPPGNVVQLTAWREDGRMVFSVEDHGAGIPKHQQARVFERFEGRRHGARPRGPGLGLAIVKSLVELHGGDMTLASEPSSGTRVTVRFPENGPKTAAQRASRRPKAVRARALKGAASG